MDQGAFSACFALGRRIACGSFGRIHEATNSASGLLVAVKLEPIRTDHEHGERDLFVEAKICRALSGAGAPAVFWTGVEGMYNIMVMGAFVCHTQQRREELCGPSLEALLGTSGRRFSLKTVVLLADQMISRLEAIHARGFLHRDVKPDNFVIGLGTKSDELLVVDFGLSKKYRSSHTGHIAYREGRPLVGTPRYASINAHLGCEQGRRDDMESLGYVLLYMLRGRLPWQGAKACAHGDKYEKIKQVKVDTPLRVLCAGLPTEFQQYLAHARALRFTDKPHYAMLRQLFRNLARDKGYVYDACFDWALKKDEAACPKPV